MRRFLAGMVLGVILMWSVQLLGSTDELFSFYSGATIMSAKKDLRRGYAAGTIDALTFVVGLNRRQDVSSAEIQAFYERQLSCLNKRVAGNLGQFTEFAEGLWLGAAEAAAGILIEDACRWNHHDR